MRSSIPLLLLFAALLPQARASETTFLLGRELMAEADYPLAAVEFRRFAMETPDEAGQAAAYLHAGYAYLRAGQPQLAGEMIARAESSDTALAHADAIGLLYAESARLRRDYDAALYFFDVLASDAADDAWKAFALRRTAAIELGRGNLDTARASLASAPGEASGAVAALDAYAAGRDKSPRLGGLLGLVPGLGYWYSGEFANGLRSLLLNGIFIFGMIETADDDQWGAFTVITFFEVTWYSGSIYGGIDAANRHNRERLERASEAIEGTLSYRPDPEVVIPVFKLNIEF